MDRADDEFEAFLLELLAEATVTIPELGTRRAAVPPIVVLTSNRTRDLHDALKRRCLYHWIAYPDATRVGADRAPAGAGVGDPLADQVAAAVARMRALDLDKPPGVAEAIDWATALRVLGVDVLDATTAARTLSAVVKYDEDLVTVRGAGLSSMTDLAVVAARFGATLHDAGRGGGRRPLRAVRARGAARPSTTDLPSSTGVPR